MFSIWEALAGCTGLLGCRVYWPLATALFVRYPALPTLTRSSVGSELSALFSTR